MAARFWCALVQISSWMLVKAEMAVMGRTETELSWWYASNAITIWSLVSRFLFQKGRPLFRALWTINIAEDLSESSIKCMA